MNRFLGYNIASEPTIFPHEKHRFPLVDGATYSFFGENMGYDDFKNPVAVLAPYFYIFTLIFCIICSAKTVKKVDNMCGKFCISVYTIIIIFSLCFTFRKNYKSLHVCSIPWKCYEGVNNTVEYSLNYYIAPDKCYDISSIGYLYADENRVGEEWSCKNSRYGCCTIDVRCINGLENGWEYDLVNRPHNGFMKLAMKKDDSYGSNCPNVNDLIETKINLELYDNYRLYFGLCFLTCFIHLTIYLPFNKKFQKTEPDSNVLP